MGASHNVFIGKVLSQIGTIGQSIGGGRAFPLSQLSVEPIYNIKGNLQGTVSEEQAGGYQNGVLIVSEGGDMFGPATNPALGTSYNQALRTFSRRGIKMTVAIISGHSQRPQN
jgi:hypothetical protein